MHPSVHARAWPDKPACIMAGSGNVLTYGQLDSLSNQGAQLLRKLGVAPGAVVAHFTDNHSRFFEIAWAAERVGARFTPIPGTLTCEEALYILRDCGAKVLIASASVSQAVALGARAQGVRLFSIGGPLEGYESFEAHRALQPATPVDDEQPGVDMLYSGGTTGKPKGVKLPWPVERRLDRPTRLTTLGQSLYGMNADTIYLCPAPLYHGAGLRWSMTVQRLGATVVVMERFDARRALAAIQRYRITHAQWVPTHFHRMLSLPPRIRSRYDLSSMKVSFHAAAPCPVPLKEEMMAWWGPLIHEYYSATEASGFCAIGPEEWLTHKGSVGKARVGTVRICNEQGEPLPPGERGVVYFEGAPAFEYHNDPARTAATRNAQGWATVGDVGRLDEDGFLYLVDRQSFTIISGGVNIYPQEIENVLVSHAAVADAAVFGVPDEDLGERVMAVVQLRDAAEAGEAMVRELLAFMRVQLSTVKIPKRIDFRAELPHSEAGKLLKRQLRAEYL